MGWVFSTHVEMHFVSSLAWDAMTGQVFAFEELSTLTIQIEAIRTARSICRLDDSHAWSFLEWQIIRSHSKLY